MFFSREMKPVSGSEMREADEKALKDYGIDSGRLMENAGLRVAEFLRNHFPDKGFSIYAGPGNNGGDALVAARRLKIWGFSVEVVASTIGEGLPAEELSIVEKLEIPVRKESSENFEVGVDGLLGYGIEGDPREPVKSMIEEVNGFETVVSVDIGSGLDPDTGEQGSPSVEPDFTVTLAAPFQGMTESNSGKVYVADIGLPSLQADCFSEKAFKKYCFN